MKPEEAKTRFQGDPGDEQVERNSPDGGEKYPTLLKVDPCSLAPIEYYGAGDGPFPFTNRNA